MKQGGYVLIAQAIGDDPHKSAYRLGVQVRELQREGWVTAGGIAYGAGSIMQAMVMPVVAPAQAIR